MKNLRSNKASGISLVALIVTIIVLIILTAAVIVTFMEGGIIEKAKEAVFKSDIRTYQEILAVKNAEKQIELATGNGEGTLLNGTTLEEIQEIIPEFKEEYENLIAISNGKIVLGTESKEPYSGWLADLGIELSSEAKKSITTNLKVGDYVDYNITGGTYTVSETEIAWLWNENGDDREDAWDFDEGEETIGYKDIMWRVLKNDGGTVTLVSADPIESIYLYGANGYLYGPNKLDEICNTVYGGRNLKVEDINELLKGDKNWGEDEKNWQYWDDAVDPNIHQVPEGVKKITDLEAITGLVIDEYYRNVPGEGKEFGDYIPNYYTYTKDSLTDIDETLLNLIFTNDSYYLSSSCVNVAFYGPCAAFRIRIVYNSGIDTGLLFHSDPGIEGFAYVYGLRPVVTLNSSIQIADVTGDGSSASSPWQLK